MHDSLYFELIYFKQINKLNKHTIQQYTTCYGIKYILYHSLWCIAYHNNFYTMTDLMLLSNAFLLKDCTTTHLFIFTFLLRLPFFLSLKTVFRFLLNCKVDFIFLRWICLNSQRGFTPPIFEVKWASYIICIVLQ